MLDSSMEDNSNKRLNDFSSLSPTLLILLFFLHMTIYVAGYEPSYNLTLSCGSTGDSTAQDKRLWVGDIGSSFIPQQQPSNASQPSEALRQDSAVDSVPYMTARIFHSQFTYTFHVPPGPKFIRLHFYPTLYSHEFDASATFFSVKIGNSTVLSNFSASLTALSLKSPSFFKEYILNASQENQVLNITFIPSSLTPNGYAFVNGIEIISIPDFLYYSRANDIGHKVIGQSYMLPISGATAMETVYRLEVGGQAIPPVNDSGMYRSWEMDDQFLTFKGSDPFNDSFRVLYSDDYPAYIAPEQVYRTARTMGPDKTLNIAVNITWAFRVYLGFNYLVRLHFCEFAHNITTTSGREFHIYIDQQVAETQADVIGWSGRNSAPVYRDYIVMLSGGSQEKHELLLQMHPNSDSRTEYSDVILNGLELFKLSGYDGNLAGPNPEPVVETQSGNDPPLSRPPARGSDSSVSVSVVAAVSVCGGLLVILSLVFLILFRRRRRRRAEEKRKTGEDGSMEASLLPSDLCRRFRLAEIAKATEDFKSDFLIGVGGFGNVYRGSIGGYAEAVAIKRLKPGSQQGAHEFLTEIKMLSRLRHLHLVSLVGYCNDGGEMILVYDYMGNGTLRDHLYKTDKPPLPWKRRLQILIGAARGLNYLHTGAKYSIIHRDVKTTNILLDDKWVAKVTDFGLSRVGPTSVSQTHVSTVVKGSFGYLDPDYFRRHQLTEKSDVYSFGVVLWEALCARPPLVQKEEKERVSLAEWARQCCIDGTVAQIIDPYLTGKIAPECLKKFGEIAVSCVDDEGIKRPSMGEVVWGLEFALQLQETAEEGMTMSHHQLDEKGELIMAVHSPLDGCSSIEDDLFSSGNGGGTTATTASKDGVSFSSIDGSAICDVFSEIVNPNAR